MALSTYEITKLTRQIVAAIDLRYDEFRKGKKNWVTPMSMSVTADKEEVTLPFLQDAGRVRLTSKNLPPTYENLLFDKLVVKLQLWEAGVQVGKYDASESDYPTLLQQAQDVGRNAAWWNVERAAEILRTGETAFPMHDGLSLFNNAHVKGGTTFDNLLAGVFSTANFQAGRVAMARFPSDFGSTYPLNVYPTDVVGPPDIWTDATLALNQQWYPVASVTAENIFQGAANFWDEAFLTDVNDWYLISNASIKPFFHYRHKDYAGPKIVSYTADTDYAVHVEKKFKWHAEMYQLLYPTRPELFVKFVNA